MLARITFWIMEKCSRQVGPKTGASKGIALIVVMATVTILGSTVNTFMDRSMVNFYLTTNQQNEIKAYFLAKSAMNLSWLLLMQQKELSKRNDVVGQAMKKSKIQLSSLLPLILPAINTGKLDIGLSGGGDDKLAAFDLEEAGATGFGGFGGNYDVEVIPEDAKIPLNDLNNPALKELALQRLCLLVSSSPYDDVFSETDEETDPRREIVGALADWIDPDEDLTTLDIACRPQMGGAGNEDMRYDLFDAKYKNKNSQFTSMSELHMVQGITDKVYDTFASSLTIYSVGATNVNEARAEQLFPLLCQYVTLSGQNNNMGEELSPCSNPIVMQRVWLIALALDGYRQFFEDPLQTLIPYYLSGETRVMDGVSPGQIVAYRNPQQFGMVVNQVVNNGELLRQFLGYSRPAIVFLFSLGIQDPWGFIQNGELPPMDDLVFNFGGGYTRGKSKSKSKTNSTYKKTRISTEPSNIYTIKATGTYGNTIKTLTAVVDFNQDGKFLYWREY